MNETSEAGGAASGSGPDKPNPGKPKTASQSGPKSWALSAAVGLLAIGGVGFGLVACEAGKPAAEQGYERFAKGGLVKLVIDPKAPAQPVTEFLDGDNKPVALQAFKGKVLIVNLWATWCAPCIKEMPTLAALQTAYADKGLVVAPISVDRLDDRASAKADLVKLGGGKLTFYGDHTYRIAYDLKAEGFPTTIVYGRDGRELGRVAGEADWNSPEAHALVEAALGE
jgi:thiol-disulfide isomerase/thioredoxin